MLKDIYCKKPKKKRGEQAKLQMNQSVSGLVCNTIKALPNAQLCFPSVWSDWLIVKIQCELANPWGVDEGHVTDTIWIFCPSTWPGPTPASNWKLPSGMKVNWVCVKLIQWYCFLPGVSPNPVHHKSCSKQIHHSWCYASTDLASLPCLEVLFWPNRDIA